MMLFTWQLIILAFLGGTRAASLWSFEDPEGLDAVILTKSSAVPSTETTTITKPKSSQEWDDGYDAIGAVLLGLDTPSDPDLFSIPDKHPENDDSVRNPERENQNRFPQIPLHPDKKASSFESENIGRGSKGNVIISETELQKKFPFDLDLIPQGEDIVFQDLGTGDKEEVKEFNVTPSLADTNIPARSTLLLPGISTKESNYSPRSVKSSQGSRLKPTSPYKPIATGFSTPRIRNLPLIEPRLVRDENMKRNAIPATFPMSTQNLQLPSPYQIPVSYVRRTIDEPLLPGLQHRLRKSPELGWNGNRERKESSRNKRNAEEATSSEESHSSDESEEIENARLEYADAMTAGDEQPLKAGAPTPAEALEKLKHLVDKIVRELSQFKQKFTLRLIRMTEKEDLKQMPEIMKDFQISPERPIFFITGGLKLPEKPVSVEETTTAPTVTSEPETNPTTIFTSSVREDQGQTAEETNASTPMPIETSTLPPPATSETHEPVESTEKNIEKSDLTDNNRRKRSIFEFEEVELPSAQYQIAGRMARTEDPFEESEPEPFFYEIEPRVNQVRELGSNTVSKYRIINQSPAQVTDGHEQDVESRPNSDSKELPIPDKALDVEAKVVEVSLATDVNLNPVNQPASLVMADSGNPVQDPFRIPQTVADNAEAVKVDENANSEEDEDEEEEDDEDDSSLSDQTLPATDVQDVVKDNTFSPVPIPTHLESESTASGENLGVEHKETEEIAGSANYNSSPVMILNADIEQVGVKDVGPQTSPDVAIQATAQIAGSSSGVNILTSDIITSQEIQEVPISPVLKVTAINTDESVSSASGNIDKAQEQSVGQVEVKEPSSSEMIDSNESEEDDEGPLPLGTKPGESEAIIEVQYPPVPEKFGSTVTELSEADNSQAISNHEPLPVKAVIGIPVAVESEILKPITVEHVTTQDSANSLTLSSNLESLEITNPIEPSNFNSELTKPGDSEIGPAVLTSSLASNADKSPTEEFIGAPLPVQVSLDGNSQSFPNVPLVAENNAPISPPVPETYETSAPQLTVSYNEPVSDLQSMVTLDGVGTTHDKYAEGPISSSDPMGLVLYTENAKPLTVNNPENTESSSNFIKLPGTTPLTGSEVDLKIAQTSDAGSPPVDLTFHDSGILDPQLVIFVHPPLVLNAPISDPIPGDIKDVEEPVLFTKPLQEDVNMEIANAGVQPVNPLTDNSSPLSSPGAYLLPQAEVTGVLAPPNTFVSGSPTLQESPINVETPNLLGQISPIPVADIDIKDHEPTSLEVINDTPVFHKAPELNMKVPAAPSSDSNGPSAFVSFEEPLNLKPDPVISTPIKTNPSPAILYDSARSLPVSASAQQSFGQTSARHPNVEIIESIKESLFHPYPIKISPGYNALYGPKIIEGPTASSVGHVDLQHKQQFLHQFFPTLREEPKF